MMRVKKYLYLSICAAAVILCFACGCSSPGGTVPGTARGQSAAEQTGFQAERLNNLKLDHSMELLYADQFSVDYYEGGFILISIRNSGRFLVVPEHGEPPAVLPDDVTVIR